MRHSKFTESQIVFAIKQVETGIRLSKVFYKIGISEATFYNCKKKYESLGYQNGDCSAHTLAVIQKDNSDAALLYVNLLKRVFQYSYKPSVYFPSDLYTDTPICKNYLLFLHNLPGG